jgi:hypothetical protein
MRFASVWEGGKARLHVNKMIFNDFTADCRERNRVEATFSATRSDATIFALQQA